MSSDVQLWKWTPSAARDDVIISSAVSQTTLTRKTPASARRNAARAAGRARASLGRRARASCSTHDRRVCAYGAVMTVETCLTVARPARQLCVAVEVRETIGATE